MEEERQLFRDKSSDKKYLTITPNIIINGYSAVETGVYSYMKKRAGEDGQFFETAFNTAKALKISKPTYLRIRNTLEKDNRIKFIGWRKGKTHPIKIYEIVDIWQENIKHYEEKRKVKNTTTSLTSSKERSKIEPLERSKIDTQKKNPIEEEPINMSVKPTDWNLAKEIEKLKTDKRRHIQIVGLWIEIDPKLNPENKDQFDSIKKRNMRPAALLKGYSDQNIKDTFEHTKTLKYLTKIELETIAKFIDEVVAKKKQSSVVHADPVQKYMKKDYKREEGGMTSIKKNILKKWDKFGKNFKGK